MAHPAINYQFLYFCFEASLNQSPFLIPKPVREYRFDPERRWRIDFAWPEHRLAVEIEGGAWTQGRHVRGGGFVRDLEKYNTLTMSGWALLRFTPKQVETCEAVRMIETWFSRFYKSSQDQKFGGIN